MVKSRLLGWLLLVLLASLLTGIVWGARHEQREKSGATDAEADLALILDHVERALQSGRSCAPSRISSEEPLGWVMTIDANGEEWQREIREKSGFACLGLSSSELRSTRNAYSYEVDQGRIIVRAFRAYLYDPDGVLPRYERRAVIENGRLVRDPKLHRLPPGGKSLHEATGANASIE